MIMEAQPEVRELYQVHTENRHLKETVSALRDALEKKQISHEEDIQKSLAVQNDENAHLKLSIVALRDELECARITHEESIQKLEQSARDEVNQLQESIRVLREQWEAYEKDQGCATA